MRNALILHMVLIIGIVNLIGLSLSKAEAEKSLVVFGSSGVSGPFYPTAGAIANAVNQKRKEYGIRVMVKTRRSSVSNLNAVISGEIDFATVQSSRIYQANKGLAEWKGSPRTDLCSVFNIHAESIILVAFVDSGIRTIRDLKNKRVAVGSPGSDLRHNALDILAAVEINYETDLSAVDNKMEETPDLLQDGAIDAFFYPVGRLNRSFMDLINGAKKVRLIPVAAAGIDHLTVSDPFYEKAVVPVTLYPGLENNTGVETLGVKTSLVTSCRAPESMVYIVTKETLENFEPFEKKHPTASTMTRKAMIEGMIAPVHPGAIKYYKESGMDAMLQP